MNKVLLTKNKYKKEGLRWKQGQVTWEEYTDLARMGLVKSQSTWTGA